MGSATRFEDAGGRQQIIDPAKSGESDRRHASSGRPRVLVIGAAGRTGRLIARMLDDRGYAVRAMTRDVEAARKHLPLGMDVARGDLESADSVAQAVVGVDVVVFAASAGAYTDGQPRHVDFKGVVQVTDSALEAGVSYIVLMSSASVTHPEHPHNCTFNSVLKWKARGEKHLRASGLSYTIVRALGLRDREGGVQGVRMVQGDRLAFGEDIARADAAAFLADVVSLSRPVGGIVDAQKLGFAAHFAIGSLIGATIEIYNDAVIPSGTHRSENKSLLPDQPTLRLPQAAHV